MYMYENVPYMYMYVYVTKKIKIVQRTNMYVLCFMLWNTDELEEYKLLQHLVTLKFSVSTEKIHSDIS